MTEIGMVLSEISYTLKKLPRWEKKEYRWMPLTQFPGGARIYKEPYGVVLLIAPWNYPFQLAFLPLVGAIAAGNCCLIKPSEFAPRTAEVMAKLIEETFDPQYVSLVQGGIEVGQELLEKDFDYIFFTGSARVGRIVMAAAAKHLTPVTLELGGKSPCLIHPSASLDLTAKRLAFGKFLNAGQTCVAPDYVLIHESQQCDFVKALKKHITAFFGPEPITNADYPKIVTLEHYHRLLKLMENETIALGGEADVNSRKIAPTVFTDVTWDSPLMAAEIFGPLLPIITYRHLDETICTIKKRDKPLAFYLFCQDNAAEEAIFTSLSFGGGCNNDTIIHLASPKLPFGGIGKSGFGAYHGKTSFETFSHRKTVVHKGRFPDFSFRYHPYSPKKMSLIKRFLK